MQLRRRYIFIGVIIILPLLWILQTIAFNYHDNKFNNPNKNKLKSLGKYAVWEQNFLLHNLDTTNGAYNFLNNEVLSGKIGFAIDLTDSIHTTINVEDNTITINAPLQTSYISYDPSTLIIIGSATSNKALNLNNRQIIKYLDQKTLQQYLPLLTDDLKHGVLNLSQQKLSDLAGKLVKIKITKMPQAKDWN